MYMCAGSSVLWHNHAKFYCGWKSNVLLMKKNGRIGF